MPDECSCFVGRFEGNAVAKIEGGDSIHRSSFPESFACAALATAEAGAAVPLTEAEAQLEARPEGGKLELDACWRVGGGSERVA